MTPTDAWVYFASSVAGAIFKGNPDQEPEQVAIRAAQVADQLCLEYRVRYQSSDLVAEVQALKLQVATFQQEQAIRDLAQDQREALDVAKLQRRDREQDQLQVEELARLQQRGQDDIAKLRKDLLAAIDVATLKLDWKQVEELKVKLEKMNAPTMIPPKGKDR